MINEVAIVLLGGMVGWQITAIYVLSGLVIAIIAGIIIGKLKLEGEVESYVYEMIEKIKAAEASGMTLEEDKQTFKGTCPLFKRLH